METADRVRAGCNFSAISGTDPKALKWDRLGYAHLAKLADTASSESFVAKTDSFEYWDENVPHHKIQTMSEYLQDVRWWISEVAERPS
ncbi:hypothetical protein IMZ48_01285 [Candidatus Bathyarchaeota archaeon]|nr:hypothetical protein [Candidatus Bathyarchaeota archaeon]